MNKAELIEKISADSSIPKKDVETVIEKFQETIIEILKNSGEVTLAGFGNFMSKRREARMGVNPRNPAEKIQMPAVNVPKFKAGKVLKDALK